MNTSGMVSFRPTATSLSRSVSLSPVVSMCATISVNTSTRSSTSMTVNTTWTTQAARTYLLPTTLPLPTPCGNMRNLAWAISSIATTTDTPIRKARSLRLNTTCSTSDLTSYLPVLSTTPATGASISSTTMLSTQNQRSSTSSAGMLRAAPTTISTATTTYSSTLATSAALRSIPAVHFSLQVSATLPTQMP